MTIDCIAGIDFGTTKIALVLVDTSGKSILFSDSCDHGSDISLPDGALKEQDVDTILSACTRLLERAEGSGYRIRTIGLTGQMHGILGVDGEGRAVTNLVTWRDGRGNVPAGAGTPSGGDRTLLQVMEEKGGRKRIASGYGIVTLYDWVVRRGIRSLGGFCTIPDYTGMLLTGRSIPSIDLTMADSIGAYDIGEGSWDWSYISALGIDRGLFPAIVPSRTLIGSARSSKWFRFAGKGEIPVAVAIGDNQASFVGSVRDFASSLLVNIGTGSQISFTAGGLKEALTRTPVDGYDVTVRPFVDGGCLVAGSALSGGVVYGALRVFFEEVGRGLFGVEAAAGPGDGSAGLAGGGSTGLRVGLYERMERCAFGNEDAGGLEVFPLFSGKRSAPAVRGRIGGIGLDNLTPANLVYGTLEGEVRILREMISEEALSGLGTLVGSGNGIKRSALLRKIVAKLFDRELLIPSHDEEAALGAAIHGAVAAGILRDWREGAELIQYGKG